ncbi:hypothetical protein HAX54_000213 [Datura stramonium]|uniref:Uncharacterized protein n=1 Tax=Datura stramonium TaxID=4076 RepID=A0ABS8T1L1_DATST|nr:hypothetical protein [Datura stramonium]
MPVAVHWPPVCGRYEPVHLEKFYKSKGKLQLTNKLKMECSLNTTNWAHGQVIGDCRFIADGGKYVGGGDKMLNIDVGNFYGKMLHLCLGMKFTKQHSPSNRRSGPLKYRLKRRSRYKALGHFLDPHFTGASQVKTGENSMWRWMSAIYLVFFAIPIFHRRLVGLHLCFTGVPPVLTKI